ncbi:glycosyltransferase family 4 protein [Candidatus Pantoea carbekii]|uniref:RfaG protein n=1 Tax=Candidatus Pantoea carbekii TaxID=1235990 RepID=U3U1Q8_9GAMM|nr:glycosyltransferase family 4 protein [Candidatus Pantoea carbekii]AKC32342.1 lipopolysaccharide core biosynthesis protein RfaG [Candidatus Pantoea carbekii]BAO00061.1 RfaG protein [Candidatus Pantoea carbekii]
MNKLRLAIVRQQYRLDGGAERFISRTLQALRNEKINFNIITRKWKNTNLYPLLNLHICNPIKLGRLSREYGFACAARKCWEREKFDIVQSHERIAGCDIFRAGDGVHRVWLEERARISRTSWKQFNTYLSPYHHYVLQAEKHLFNAPSLKAVICNSNMVKKNILRFFSLNAEKIHVIYNPIDSEKFQPAMEITRYRSRQILNLPLNSTVMIYVGSGFERKGLKVAIEAISNSDRYLIIVGQDKNFSFYQQLANQLHCLARLRFVGIQQDVRPFYHAADALLLPTFYDPFPNVVLEAMACGLAIITSTNCGGAELINIGQEGFVCNTFDIKSLNEAILATPSRTDNSTMGDAARQKIQFLTPERFAKLLSSLYQKVINV